VECEVSGRVRGAFCRKGHDAVSCDITPSDSPGEHIIVGPDISDIEVLRMGWDLMIAHPPCTHLAVSGSRWFKDKRKEQEEALKFVQLLMDAPIDRIMIENPVSIISTRIRKPDQIIQPWMFGHYETKATCLWLKNLPPLKALYSTKEECREALGIAAGVPVEAKVHNMSPGPDRGKLRGLTYLGIAEAFAEQWG
jgi:hypothetical protein